ncbi:MAG TPA: hypothetical protein VM782_18065 [Stellaceae bacterium]|nr:hypothetical protein [Stellaceae bacterium]
MKRRHAFTIWVAVVALLIDALLPSAVSAAAASGAEPALALCGGAEGGTSAPVKRVPVLPMRHCALCTAPFTAILTGRNPTFVSRLVAGRAHTRPASILSAPLTAAAYTPAQPRAPPSHPA